MSGPPLDEIQWRDIEAVRFYNGINADNLHLYFMGSPFCDPSSNNKNTEVQARHMPELYELLANRKRFEDSLRDSMGIKYLIEDGPALNSPDMNPVWVIRKLNRVREYDVPVTKTEGTYFAFAENVYQAPAVKDILTSRLLSITNSLQKLYEAAADMPYFTPSQGYTYVPLDATKLPSATDTLTSHKTSLPGTPLPPLEPSQMSTLPATQQSYSSSAHAHAANNTQQSRSSVTSTSNTSQSTSLLQERSLLHSLTLATRYQDEFMDENPLLGEPGSFHFTATQTHIRAQQAKASASASNRTPIPSAATSMIADSISGFRSGTSSKGASPAPGATSLSMGATPTSVGSVARPKLGARKRSRE